MLADDLVQDCLVRAWSRFHLWRRGSNLRAWLFTILHNQHANLVRQQKRRPTLVPLHPGETERAVEPAQEYAVEISFHYRRDDDIGVFYWVNKGMGYAIAGQMEKDKLLEVAKLAYREIDPM